MMVDVEWYIWKELRIYVLKVSQMRNKATTISRKNKRLQEKICNHSSATWLCNGQCHLIIVMQTEMETTSSPVTY